MLNAWKFSEAIGMLLNGAVTIRWKSIGIEDEPSASRVLAMLIDREGKRRKRKGLPAAIYIWTHETAPDAGLHSHSMWALGEDADEAEVDRLIEHWETDLADITGVTPPPRTIQAHRSDRTFRQVASTAKQRKGNLAYLLKAVSAKTTKKTGLDREPDKAGVIYGRRACVAHAIGQAERAKVGWRERGVDEFSFHAMAKKRQAARAKEPSKTRHRLNGAGSSQTRSAVNPPTPSTSWRPTTGPAP